MASLVLGAVGAVVGGAIGGPAGAQVGFSLGALVGGFFNNNGPTYGQLWDLHVTGSGYGLPIPWMYGGVRVGGNLIWSTPLMQHTAYVTPGKGGGPAVKDYVYTVNCAFSVGRGPIYGIRRIWAQDLLIYDSTNVPPSPFAITVYNGDEEQMPNSLIQSYMGAGITPAYRGQAYFVIENMDLTNWSNVIPQMAIETLPDPCAQTTVYDVLADVGNACGLVEGVDYNFGAAYDDIVGYVVYQRQAGYAMIQSLLQAFSTDMTEANGQLVAIRRGEPSVGTITQSDLGCVEWSASGSDDPPPLVTSKRVSDLSLPFAVELGYSSFDQLYQASTQRAIRHRAQSIEDLESVNTTITLQDVQATQIAAMLLDTRWLERSTSDVSIGFKWLNFIPGSPCELPINGNNVRSRILAIDISSFGIIKTTMTNDGSANSIGGPTSGYMTES
jgi:hypothetical protein